MTAAIKESTATPATILSRYAYGYGPAGNRLFEQIDDQVVAASHDVLNRLQTHTLGGPLQFVGGLNESAAMQIDGHPATVDPSNVFQGTRVTAPGTTTVTLTATDPAGNVATQQYEVDVTGSSRSFTYDANGNVTSDGTRTLEWDALNQLVAVTAGARRSEFTYDGQQRRVRIVEKEHGVVQSDTKVVRCQAAICESRLSDGTSVVLAPWTGMRRGARRPWQI